MKRKNISILLIAAIIVVALAVGVNAYLDYQDEQNFKNALIQWNQTHNEMEEFANSTPTWFLSETGFKRQSNYIDKEIEILENYTNHSKNQEYKEYATLLLNHTKNYQEYMISMEPIAKQDNIFSQAAIAESINITKWNETFNNDRKDIINYQNSHPALKNKLIEWGVLYEYDFNEDSDSKDNDTVTATTQKTTSNDNDSESVSEEDEAGNGVSAEYNTNDYSENEENWDDSGDYIEDGFTYDEIT